MKKILSIEDDAALALGIKAGLEAEGFAVTHIADGAKGYATALQNKHDAILLDVMLPGKNGTEICRDLRLNGIDTPILMLTSRADETDRIVGLEIGADDYIDKPFSMRELAAPSRKRNRCPRLRQSINSQHLQLTLKKKK